MMSSRWSHPFKFHYQIDDFIFGTDHADLQNHRSHLFLLDSSAWMTHRKLNLNTSQMEFIAFPTHCSALPTDSPLFSLWHLAPGSNSHISLFAPSSLPSFLPPSLIVLPPLYLSKSSPFYPFSIALSNSNPNYSNTSFLLVPHLQLCPIVIPEAKCWITLLLAESLIMASHSQRTKPKLQCLPHLPLQLNLNWNPSFNYSKLLAPTRIPLAVKSTLIICLYSAQTLSIGLLCLCL